MAKVSKFNDDLLLGAVVSYADSHCGKIKATELAEWASENVTGLEGVRDYHFLRPKTSLSKKTGTVDKSKRPCTIRLGEINRARGQPIRASLNVLLRSSDIDSFFQLERTGQRSLILEARMELDMLEAKIRKLTIENVLMKAENDRQKENMERLADSLDAAAAEQERLDKAMRKLLKLTDEAQRKEALGTLGLKDGGIDISKLSASLNQTIEKAFSIKEAIRNDQKDIEAVDDQDIFEGVDF